MSEPILAVAQCSGAFEQPGENVMTHVRLAALAAEYGAKLVLFPELSLTGYRLDLGSDQALQTNDPRLQPLQAVADTHGIAVVAGAPIATPAGLHIGSMIFAPGVAPCLYEKRFLGQSEKSCFTEGQGGPTLKLGDETVAFAICADITHAEHACDAADSGATIYAASCLLADGYDAETEMLQRYAREHRMIVMMANYAPPVTGWVPAGGSAIWDNEGSRVVRAPSQGEVLVVAARSANGWHGTIATSPG